MSYRLGVDVGGTFTDLLVIDEASGRTWRDKVPSTPHDPSEAVIAGARQLCDRAGITPQQLELFLHGTTVATNAVLEHKIARVGLIVTEGYRHILQIARSLVPGGLAAWIVWPKPEPMAPLEATIEAPERMGADGEIVRALDEAGLRRNIQRLRDERIEAVTVCLINSYMNPLHERRVAEIVAEEMPGMPVSISADILPEMQEYERALTTVAVSSSVARWAHNPEVAGSNPVPATNLAGNPNGFPARKLYGFDPVIIYSSQTLCGSTFCAASRPSSMGFFGMSRNPWERRRTYRAWTLHLHSSVVRLWCLAVWNRY